MRKAIIIIFSVILPFQSLYSQTGESRSNVALGINGGVAMNTIMFDPTIKQSQLIGPTMGATLRITSEKYFKTYCALQVEFNLSKLGWKENILNNKSEKLSDTYERNLTYLQLPFLARLAWGREKHGWMGYFLVGPQVGYMISEKSKRSDEWTLGIDGLPDRPNNLHEQYDMPIDRKFDYGITAGIGVEWNTSVGHFLLDGRYYYGLADVYNNSKKDVFGRSNHSTIFVKFAYLFDIR